MQRSLPPLIVAVCLIVLGAGIYFYLNESSGTSSNTLVGSPAPVTQAEDVEGKVFALSDFKGKVVVLDFWGFWCGPCVRLIPHAKALVKKLEKEPFVMIGVNTDADRDLARLRIRNENVPWRSFHDGAERRLTALWQVEAFPSLFVIDHRGIVRYSFVGDPGEKLDAAVNKLLTEMKDKP